MTRRERLMATLGGKQVDRPAVSFYELNGLATAQFAEKVKRALAEGTAGEGRGFVLMPSACPYGRVLSSLALKNYEKMIELVETV